jgi:hypothetical protein
LVLSAAPREEPLLRFSKGAHVLDHKIGCRSHNTGCDGDCDCRSFAELDAALTSKAIVVDDITFQRFTNAIRRPCAPTRALIALFCKR